MVRGVRCAGIAVALAVLVGGCGGGDDESTDTATASTASVTSDQSDASTGGDDEPDQDDAPLAAALTEEDLEGVVLDGWDLIWARDFAPLIDLYTDDCQAQLDVSNFEDTFGVALSSFEELGIDMTDIDVSVEISDFVENTSASATSTLTFPGEEPSEEAPASWVVENDEWRNADCDEVLAASGGATIDSGEIGSLETPAAFGSAFDMDEWRATVVDVRDPAAEGLVASFSEPPPAGQVDIMVTYAISYFGDVLGEADPFLVTAFGSAEYASFDGNCALAGDVLAAEGISTLVSVLPGQQVLVADCFTVPVDEADSLVFELEHAFSLSAPIVHFSASGDVVEDPGPRTAPSIDLGAGALPFGETVPLGLDWTFSMIDVVDGVDAGLMSQFGEAPPSGSTHAVAVYEATYTGPEATVTDPFTIEGLGSAVFDSLFSLCSVDGDAVAAAYETTDAFEFASGETYRAATCLTVPLDEVDGLVMKVDNVFDFEAEPVRFSR